MKYLQFKYTPNNEFYKIFHKLLKLRDCKIYISKILFSKFFEYIMALPMRHYLNMNIIHTRILKFPKMNKIIIQSDRVRDGIFYVGKD